MFDLTVAEVLEEAARRWPQRCALSGAGRRWSFAQLQVWSEQLAGRLARAGVRAGDVVVLLGANSPQWVALEFAVARLAAILVPANTALEREDLRYLLRHCGASFLLVGTEAKGHDLLGVVASLDAGELPETILLIEGGELPSALPLDDGLSEPAPPRVPMDLDSVVNVQYTSGTTGFPKGVTLSSRNIVNNAMRCGEILGLTPEDRVLCHVPLFHCFGCVVVVLGSFTHGASVHLTRVFDPLSSAELIEREEISVVHGVPSMFQAILSDPGASRHSASSVRSGIMAGADCPASLVRELAARWGATEMIVGYGLTEASPHVCYTPRHAPLESKLGTVGVPLEGTELRLVDPESGAVGHRGEIQVRGDQVMRGYFHDPEATAEAISSDGWLRTGDLAEEDGRGGYRIVGRLKEMISRGGENIYPAEVEEAIRHHPKVAEVAVFAVPDPRLGETVAAAVVAAPGEVFGDGELVSWLRERISHTKCPAAVHVLAELPMTASGKIKRHLLSARFS